MHEKDEEEEEEENVTKVGDAVLMKMVETGEELVGEDMMGDGD